MLLTLSRQNLSFEPAMQRCRLKPARRGTHHSGFTGNWPYNIKIFEERVMPAKSLVLTRSAKLQTARLEARISPDLHLIVKRAAEIQGRTMTDFVIHALQIAASQTIERADRVRLSVLDQEAFANALIAPAKPNAALKRAFAKANKLLAA
jgi:uncharacterized protein (DUF1778 family)